MATAAKLFDHDRSNMRAVLRTFPEQVRHAVQIAEQVPPLHGIELRAEVVVAGVGGSAIGADLVRSYCAALRGAQRLRINVWRGYGAPPFLDRSSVLVASSYSGDTEETLSVYADARKRTTHLYCITTGGQLARLAKRHRVPCILIPAGFQPRAAIGYSFFPLLGLVLGHPAVEDTARRTVQRSIPETIEVLEQLSEECAEPTPDNPALALAKLLRERLPVVYGAYERTDAIALRWRGQIQENAKQLAFSHLLPEMNHNEINGWHYPPELVRRSVVLLLRDRDDHRRIALRFDALADILRRAKVAAVRTVEGRGNSLLARTMSLVYLGDWTSYYLALLNGVDPTPVPVISRLKHILATAR
ncbi:MAG: bifunctional phosphoglucose/phosphomannose isomerase [Chlorobi bacterium]|jgi:glucose/mannose-6-phosphate isomerase|nr:bifunctional phosphoglucose/phosphomannose isomerase [Chlorobiota bacterium]